MEMNAWKWLNENEMQYKIWNDKYRYDGESFDGWLDRLSSGDEMMRDMLANKDFLFGGRLLANLNTGTKQGVSNCVTVGYVEDDLTEIMATNTALALSFKAEAGVGLALSKIRPKGARIGEFGEADGVIGFMKMFDGTAEAIRRGGQRRGAVLMGLHCDHPDVLDFIRLKKGNTGSAGVVKNANLSVMMTDEFMEHYTRSLDGLTNGVYRKDFIVESTGEIIEHYVNTIEIMNAIVDLPEKAFEPGILFVDRFTETHLFGPIYGEKELFTNACSEFYGENGTVCLLGSMNVSNFVVGGYFDFERFELAVETAIRHLDAAHGYGIGRNGVEIQNKMASDYRGIGLGIMGLADMFIKLEMKYGSDASINAAEKITRVMRLVALRTSRELAKEKGQPIGIVLDEFRAAQNNTELKYRGLRNNSLISIAPAGTIATMLGISTGCEPVFRNEYVRTMKTQDSNDTEKDYVVRHRAIQELMDERGLTETPDYCNDSTAVDPIDKVKILAAIQKSTDLSISNTTNFPRGTTVNEIKDMYVEAWKLKCKGVTCYVDGSLDGVLNEVSKKKDEEIERRVDQEAAGINPKVDITRDEFVIGVNCPDCGTKLVADGGCKVCPACGYSPCN